MEKNRSTISHGLSDNVRSPQTRTNASDSDSNESTTSNVSFKSDQSKEENGNFKGKVSPLREEMEEKQTRTSDSDSDSNESTTSSVSFKSDRSKEENWNFKGKLSPLRQISTNNKIVPLKHKASTGSKCSSIKTDQSQDLINANKRCLRLEVQKKLKELEEEEALTSDSDSNESTTSNVSFKSDQSKEEIITFRERRSPLRKALLKALTRTSDSNESTTSNVSIKSDQSKENITNFNERHSQDSPGATIIRGGSTTRSPLFPLKRRATTRSICLSSEKDLCNERKRNKSLLHL